MLGQGISFHTDLVDLYTHDFYALSVRGYATGCSSLESLVDEHILSTLFSQRCRCDWCGQRRCHRCGECHNPDCEVYYELDCEDEDTDEDERYADLIRSFEPLDDIPSCAVEPSTPDEVAA